MTKEKVEFLLEFFENDQYPGWRGIAEKLIEHGTCIVAGRECIWKGGIGNFIDTSPVLNAIDCSLYEFDLNYFLSSEWFMEYKEQRLEKLREEAELLINEINEIEDLWAE